MFFHCRVLDSSGTDKNVQVRHWHLMLRILRGAVLHPGITPNPPLQCGHGTSTAHSILENQDRGCLEPPAPGCLPQRPASTVAVDVQRELRILASFWHPQTP